MIKRSLIKRFMRIGKKLSEHGVIQAKIYTKTLHIDKYLFTKMFKGKDYIICKLGTDTLRYTGKVGDVKLYCYSTDLLFEDDEITEVENPIEKVTGRTATLTSDNGNNQHEHITTD